MNSATMAAAQGADHGCWMETDRSLHCTGYNAVGQLGDGTTNWNGDALVPGTWTNVWAGEEATCATRDVGGPEDRLYCWGEGFTAGVGDTNQLSPVESALPGGEVREVTFGQDFGCAILGAGELWCWGRGSWGRLGTGNQDDQPQPVRVGTRSDWKSVAAGDWHACAVATDSTLWCWGHADQGQAGPVTGFAQEPVQVGGAGWNDVACTYHNTCAIKTDGTRWCAGANDAGELGSGTSWSSTLVVVP
jgi:alpha-tubulin suppressor-like RCC1 family protein